jgi:hypothetical protein
MFPTRGSGDGPGGRGNLRARCMSTREKRMTRTAEAPIVGKGTDNKENAARLMELMEVGPKTSGSVYKAF